MQKPVDKSRSNARSTATRGGGGPKGEATIDGRKTIRLADFRRRNRPVVFFNRRELRQLLEIYSRRVMTGEWRDYAIDHQREAAVFSIFRNSFDSPLFAIAKRPNGKRCDYLVFSGPRKLKHGATMDEALSIFDRQLRAITTSV
ncbi:MAG: DUF2794 domain-containing protein [Alphaproteobacteria bacterium]|jgi:hypothetical protein|nr:DUF2794 domain-containing protein [Alphaproteobacteria bacterium]